MIKAPLLVYFKEVKPGDIRKARAESNDADTGGGARDIRIRPEHLGERIVEMFPRATTKAGVWKGTIRWMQRGSEGSAEIEFWRPTEARPGEYRIGTIPKILPWNIPLLDLERATAQGRHLFFVLTMDEDGKVWADVLDEATFHLQDAGIVSFMRERLDKTPANNAAQGVIDFRTGRKYP